MRQAFGNGFWVGGALAGLIDGDAKAVSPGGERRIERDAEQPVGAGGGVRSYPAADGQLTFDKLSIGFLVRQQDERRPTEPHPRRAARLPRELAELWAHMCPAQVYEAGPDAGDGLPVELSLAPSNCVQCGAITAKGGRLTPPEGGSGPEYTLT